MSEFFFIRCTGARSKKLSRPGDQPLNIGGVPCFYRSREAVRIGKYVDANGKNVEIKPDDLDNYVSQFNKMKSRGVKVFMPHRHPVLGERITADMNRGYVYAMKREGDTLKIGMQLIGEDALKTASRSELSIGVSRNLRDGAGNTYTNAIDHVAMVVDPACAGLGDVEPAIAASRGATADGNEFVFSAPLPSTGVSEMKLNDKNTAAIKTLLGDKTPAELTPDNAVDALLSRINELGESAKLSRPKSDFEKIEKDLENANARVTQLSRTTTENEPDPEMLLDRADLTIGRIDLSIGRGDMPKFLGDKIKAVVKKDGKASAFLLSRHADTGNERLADFLINLFDGAKLGAATGGEKTAAQILLSRQIPGKEDAKEPVNPYDATIKQLTGAK